jgi:nucleoside 2-deoxyribosyltransferase
MPRIYCAGPLFNDPERDEMQQSAEALEQAGHETFLPHRDGLEFAQLLPALLDIGVSQGRADGILQRAIFSLDVYQLLVGCQGVVVNLNGRVPDEGTVVEASLAWHAGKPLVLYKRDARTLLDGSDNPMLSGLGGFEMVRAIDELPQALELAFRVDHTDRVNRTLQTGAAIAQLRQREGNVGQLAAMLASGV